MHTENPHNVTIINAGDNSTIIVYQGMPSPSSPPCQVQESISTSWWRRLLLMALSAARVLVKVWLAMPAA